MTRRKTKAGVTGVFESTTIDFPCSDSSDDDTSNNHEHSSTSLRPPQPPPAKKARHDHAIFNFSASNVTTSISVAEASSPKKKPPIKAANYDFTAAGDWLDNDSLSSNPLGVREPEERNIGFSSLSTMYEQEFPDAAVKGPRVRNLWEHPMLRWIRDDRPDYLDEALRAEGRGSFASNPSCNQCKTVATDLYRCEDCSAHGALHCAACTSLAHKWLPYHRIELWTGEFFKKAYLKDLGVRIQLGHPHGERCLNPEPARKDDFVVVDTFGIHEVALDFCACEASLSAQRKSIQLLRANLFPSTSVNPRTAATFNVLKHFHILSFESKISPYEYIKALERITSNCDSEKYRDRYEEFQRMVQQWRNIKMLKRAGRGHASTGIGGTKPGECAILCPACPQPDINLPEGWENEPEDRQWIYALFLGIDGNFRLKRKRVSNDERDPGLCDGWAYVVPEGPFKQFLAANWDYKQERSTCVNHNAVNQADKEARGLAATGATTTDCIRHELKRPSGVGDFQKGERYINTDFVFFSSISGTKCRRINVSYDVACQWLRHIFERAERLPSALRWSICIVALCFFIPKFHISAHTDACNRDLSFNLTPGSARTDGEAPERGWAHINPLATSTKEMGPGSRRDTLDDHFNDWNWKKVIKMKDTLLNKIVKAVPEKAKHTVVQRDFERAIPAETLKEWTTAVESWEQDRANPNPYEVVTKRPTERAVRLELSQDAAEKLDNVLQEEREAAADRSAAEIHPALMVAIGLDIESAQRALSRDVGALGPNPTDTQLAKLVDRSNALRRKIANWIDIQSFHMPQTVALRQSDQPADESGTRGVSAQNIRLYLPSSFKSSVSTSLRLYEWKLRQGQAFDALNELRHHLRLRSQLFHYKKVYTRGIRQVTRSVDALLKCKAKIDAAAAKYRVAHKALTDLSVHLGSNVPQINWTRDLKLLADGDIRGLSNLEDGETEGRRKVSWIWRTEGILPDESEGGIENAVHDPGFNDAIRIEWCRTRARAMRWSEEVELLQEEMRRVKQYCAFKSGWWTGIAGDRGISNDNELVEGLNAYAAEQAAMWRAIQLRCEDAWKGVDSLVTTYRDPDEDE